MIYDIDPRTLYSRQEVLDAVTYHAKWSIFLSVSTLATLVGGCLLVSPAADTPGTAGGWLTAAWAACWGYSLIGSMFLLMHVWRMARARRVYQDWYV